ncbi:MAG: RNA polymerase sigma factor [Bradymonadia bacterium]
MDADDDQLLADCLAGTRKGWQRLVERYSRYVYFLINATAKRHGASITEDEAEDLHNDFFVALLEDDYRRLRAFGGKNGCSLRSWLRVICIRRTIDSLRRRRKTVSLTTDDDGPTLQLEAPNADPLQALLTHGREQRRARLGELAQSLPADDRILLDMIYVQKLGATEISAALRIKKGAVYTRKTRLVQRLREAAKHAGLTE